MMMKDPQNERQKNRKSKITEVREERSMTMIVINNFRCSERVNKIYTVKF